MVFEFIVSKTWIEISVSRCNVPHKPDLRTANYAPEFPPNVITVAAIFTISTDAAVTAAAASIIAVTASIIAVTAAAVYTAGSVAIIPTSFRPAVYCATALLTPLRAAYKTTDSVAVVSASDHRPHPVHPFGTRT
jgi:hypothetical protein